MLGCVPQLRIASCHKIAAEPEVVGPNWEYPWLYAWPSWDQKQVSALLAPLSLGHPVDNTY